VEKVWSVYIITNYNNSVLYVGITNELQRRVSEHKNGLSKNAFTRKYRLYKLVWFNEFNDPLVAIEMEKKIKSWRREKKINLIKESNPSFENLFTLR